MARTVTSSRITTIPARIAARFIEIPLGPKGNLQQRLAVTLHPPSREGNYGTQTQIRRIPAIFAEEGPADGETQKLRYILFTRSSRAARARSSVLQTARALDQSSGMIRGAAEMAITYGHNEFVWMSASPKPRTA